ncbi:MAG: EamA family transporter [Myxococcota bacterium]
MSLDASVALLVLLAAFLHASWNAITKAGRDPLLTLWVVTGTGGVLASVAIFFVDFPARAAWPYLAGSIVLHLVYQLFLVTAYRLGDLSQVYPIARGLSPCVVAALAAIFIGELPVGLQLVGLLMVSLGIASLAGGARGRGAAASGSGAGRARWALAASVVTGLLIGAYTFVDGQGVRLSEQPFDFIAWGFFLDALPITLVAVCLRRRDLGRFFREEGARAAGGGVMATLAYAIVLWALSQGGMAQISALRETSVIVAAVIGTRVLREPFGARRVLAAAVVAIGVVLLQS